MMKKIALAVAIVVLAIAGAAYYFASNLDSLVKAAIERYGSEATQARVTLKSVELKPTQGSGALAGLTVANPAGFSSNPAISLGDIRVVLDIGSLQGNPIIIKEVAITQPAIAYEYAANGGNLETLQKNVQAYAAKLGGGQAGAKPAGGQAAGGDKGAERKVIIELLTVRDGKIAISHSALQGRALSAGLPTITLRDIGKDKGGATPAEVAERVIGTISAQAARVSTGELQKQAGELLKGGTGAVGGAVGGAAGGAADKLKGLLGK